MADVERQLTDDQINARLTEQIFELCQSSGVPVYLLGELIYPHLEYLKTDTFHSNLDRIGPDFGSR